MNTLKRGSKGSVGVSGGCRGWSCGAGRWLSAWPFAAALVSAFAPPPSCAPPVSAFNPLPPRARCRAPSAALAGRSGCPSFSGLSPVRSRACTPRAPGRSHPPRRRGLNTCPAPRRFPLPRPVGGAGRCGALFGVRAALVFAAPLRPLWRAGLWLWGWELGLVLVFGLKRVVKRREPQPPTRCAHNSNATHTQMGFSKDTNMFLRNYPKWHYVK